MTYFKNFLNGSSRETAIEEYMKNNVLLMNIYHGTLEESTVTQSKVVDISSLFSKHTSIICFMICFVYSLTIFIKLFQVQEVIVLGI